LDKIKKQIKAGKSINNDTSSIDKLYMNTSIGKPTNNTKICILDDKLRKVKKGGIGEIYISNSLSLGYLNNEELTKKKFIANPLIQHQTMIKFFIKLRI
jgi:non-ribosomal peptide synthetase component F